MPEDITTALTDYQAAALNVANAEDAHEAASEEYEQAANHLEAAQLALEDAIAAETAARQRYISALRRNGWVRTADGPQPVSTSDMDVCGGPYGCRHLRADHTRPYLANSDACTHLLAGSGERCPCTGFCRS